MEDDVRNSAMVFIYHLTIEYSQFVYAYYEDQMDRKK